MDNIKKVISEKRPNLSVSSINTYASILKNLYKKVFENDNVDLNKFDTEIDKVLFFLKNITPNKRKTILSSLVVITEKKPYRDLMMEDVKDLSKETSLQEKNEKQTENWIDGSGINQIYEQLKKDAELLYKKKTHSINDLQIIQQYIILSLLGGMHIPPRRSKDFVDFKIKNIDKTKDNYLDKNKMVFNSYKTAKTYGQQIVEIPSALKSILTKWIKINPSEYLLFDTNLGKLSSVKLNQRLNKIFGKKISTNQMRHTYLSDKYQDTIKVKDALTSDMQNMGSSLEMSENYIKKN